jgi:hypothetical protein
MTAYRTATSARVLPPVSAPKPALYAGRVAELMALGLTAVQAMHRIERGDKHRALAPNNQAGNQGSPRKPRPMSNQRQVALASLTDEFTDAIPGIAEKLEISNTAARSLLRAMVSDEKVECRKTNGRIMWRRL